MLRYEEKDRDRVAKGRNDGFLKKKNERDLNVFKCYWVVMNRMEEIVVSQRQITQTVQ